MAHQEDATAAATLLCNAKGGILAEALLLRMEDHWLLTSSPGNHEKLLSHLAAHAGGLEVKIDDQTDKNVRLDVIGPAAGKILDAVLPFRVSELPPGAVLEGSMLVVKYVAVRADLGSLWGAQVILPALLAGRAWNYITIKAGDRAIKPAGMAALDILRIEEGVCRYGHEINETIDPLTAGLEKLVDLRHDFVGKEAISRLWGRPPARRRVRLAVAPERSPLHGATEIKDSIFLFDLQEHHPAPGRGAPGRVRHGGRRRHQWNLQPRAAGRGRDGLCRRLGRTARGKTDRGVPRPAKGSGCRRDRGFGNCRLTMD